MSTLPTCRFESVLFAREAPVGLIFRRASSKWWQLIKWNTDTDAFEPGAWFKGTIYPSYCDLSPDGKYLIYSARDYSNSESDPKAPFPVYWTAISKVPWMTVLTAWQNGHTSSCGGFFETDSLVLLRVPPIWFEPIKGELPSNWELIPWHKEIGSDEFQGWISVSKIPTAGSAVVSDADPNCGEIEAQKTFSSSGQILIRRRSRTDRGFHDVFTVSSSDLRQELPGVTWADFDPQGRIVCIRDGRLLVAEFNHSCELKPLEIPDSVVATPKSIKSPDWARRW